MKKWGIWGLGIVGKSVVRHLSLQDYSLSAFDNRTLSSEEMEFLYHHNVRLYNPSELEQFIVEQDYIVPSPGIDTAPYPSSKFIQELDLFTQAWHKPMIAVTGSLGKTGLICALDEILRAQNLRLSTGGNIGTPLLDLLPQENGVDYALLELSSFQLEHAQPFSPDLAIWTTFHPNHLDRHRTIDSYFMAKYQIMKHQSPDQKMLVPLCIAQRLRDITDRPGIFFTPYTPTEEEEAHLQAGDTLYTLENDLLLKTVYGTQKADQTAIVHTQSQTLLHKETWLCALAACDLLGFTRDKSLILPELTPTEHRLEYIGTVRGAHAYNDSKSTIVESTLAAVHKLAPRPVHLILGGLSKGIDRGHQLHLLKGIVLSVACFGDEAETLHTTCKDLAITSTAHRTLPDALQACVTSAHPEDVILLSPGGSSHDLYENFTQRGDHFKKLVKALDG